MTVDLQPISSTLWMEFTGFKNLVEKTMVQENANPRSAILKEWFNLYLKRQHETAKSLASSHCFDTPPNMGWLDWFTPRLNQSVLLATAVPPMTVDMSTTEVKAWRGPVTWSAFPQFRQSIKVEFTKPGGKHRMYYTRQHDIELGEISDDPMN